MTPTLHPTIFPFLDAIAEHNSREFFATVKPLYQEILESVTDLCQYLIDQTGVEYELGTPLTPKQCLFRLYRDARRIKPGDPLYKHHFSFMIAPGGKKSMGSGYYLHIEQGNTYLASGIYRAKASYLKPLREKFADHGDHYLKILRKKKFKQTFGSPRGQSLKRPPKGFTIDTPHLDLIMKKQHIVSTPYSDEQALSDEFAETVLRDIGIVKEWSEWLNEI